MQPKEEVGGKGCSSRKALGESVLEAIHLKGARGISFFWSHCRLQSSLSTAYTKTEVKCGSDAVFNIYWITRWLAFNDKKATSCKRPSKPLRHNGRSATAGLGRKVCKVIDLLTNIMTKKTLSPERRQIPEAIPDFYKPFNESLKTDNFHCMPPVVKLREQGHKR